MFTNNPGKPKHKHTMVNVFTWLIGAVLTVAVVVVHLLEGDDLGAIDAQEGLPLSVETFVCHRINK